MPIGTVAYPTALDSASTLFDPANNVTTTLNGSLSSGAVSMTVTDAAKFASTGGILTVDDEIIYWGSKSGNTLNGLLRGREGTAAATHADGAAVNGFVTARHLSVLRDAILALEAKLGIGVDTPVLGDHLVSTATGTALWQPQPVFNVLDFGATRTGLGSSGAVDCITAFEAARDAIYASARPGILYVPGGVYGLSRTFQNTSPTLHHLVQLRGEGPATYDGRGGTLIRAISGFVGDAVVKMMPTSFTSNEPTGYCTVRDIAIDGNKDALGATVADGLVAAGYRMRIDNVSVYDCTGNGFVLRGQGASWAAYDSMCTRLHASWNDKNGIITQDRGEDMHFAQIVCHNNGHAGIQVGGSSSQFNSVHCYSNLGSGILIAGGVARTWILGSKFEHNEQGNIWLIANASSGPDMTKILGCEFTNPSEYAVGIYSDIILGGAGLTSLAYSGTISSSVSVRRTQIQGCHFRYSSAEDPSGLAKGLSAIALGANAQQSDIKNNIFNNGGPNETATVVGGSYTDKAVTGTGSTSASNPELWNVVEDNIGAHNPRGFIAPPVTNPVSGTTYRNSRLARTTVYLWGGSVTNVEIATVRADGSSTWQQVAASSPCQVELPVGAGIRVTRSSAPSWAWYTH